MCGIVGIVGDREAAPRLLAALKTLEYRGYDSAGIATLHEGERQLRKAVGKLAALDAELLASPMEGNTGIGHTRWATHGAPTLNNSHPHTSGKVAVVHNGIIENYAELREELGQAGYTFVTETDTETVAVLIDHFLNTGLNETDAFKKALSKLEGAFALGVLIEGCEDMFAARRGSPLAIGYGMGENYIGSDSIALAGLTSRVTYLNDGDWAVLSTDEVTIYDALGQPANREIKIVNVDQMVVDKGRHRHFMAKEIHDQPAVLAYVLSHYLNDARDDFSFSGIEKLDFTQIDRVTMVACGTAHYATYVAKYWIEEWARVPCEVEIASEFRYREPPLGKNNMVIFVSQSGETADTYAALQYAKSQGALTVGLVNGEESSIARDADIMLPLKAGVEISVASTKAFTAQLMALAVVALLIAKQRGAISPEILKTRLDELTSAPRLLSEAMATEAQIVKVSQQLARASDILFLGRGSLYPLALEGALKLKELTYIHAEGYASGELKHGPIALVDENVPVIVFAPHDRLIEKSVSNMQEVAARGGQIIFCTDKEGLALVDDTIASTITMPKVPESIAPIVYAVPAQLLAYYTAISKGTDVDQPRNLAKSVTVE